MLQEGRESTSYLCNTDKERKVYIVASQWLNVCHTGLDTFREWLTLDDAIADNEATQAGAGAKSNCASDEHESFSR